MKIELKRVVITGLGVVSPLGNSVDEFWKNILAGKNGVRLIESFDTTNFKTKFAAEVKDFDPLAYFEKGEVRKYDPFTQYAVASAEEAIKNAQLNFDTLNRNKIGVIWGSGNGGIQTFQEQVIEFGKGNGTPRFNPFFIPKMIADIPSGIISIRHGLRGLNFSTISACASSNNAIIDAFNYIRLGKANIVITGGSEAAVNETSVGGFNASRALSTNNEEYETASRPFDPTRDGFVLGEGAGALVLESLESALSRNASIIAEIIGSGLAGDAYHLTGTHPDGEGAYLGMIDALEEAHILPGEVDYVNAHATSTMMGDLSELRAIERVFGTRKSLAISATKSMTGHLLGAAGAIESIITILSIRDNIIPPTINTRDIQEGFSDKFNFVLGKAEKKEVNVGINNTFGFGGHIATTLFKKWKS
jgi:3-oxoacyl-[acyl-carrier-protein] synthase II